MVCVDILLYETRPWVQVKDHPHSAKTSFDFRNKLEINVLRINFYEVRHSILKEPSVIITVKPLLFVGH